MLLTVSSSVSLFDGLPDEVITRIFDFAVRSEPLPSGPFILNKRLYSLSRRSYYESWEADEDRLLPFLRCRDLQLLVKDLSYQPSSHNAELLAYEAATLGLLTSLRILECEGPAEASLPDDVFEFPRFFSSTLRSLRHLKALSLTFNGPFDFEDEDFTIGRDLPSLRTLTLDSNSLCTQQLLTPPCSSLRHLTICLSDSVLNHEFEDLPWTSLDEILIHVGCGAWGFRRIDGVLESLHHALQADTVRYPKFFALFIPADVLRRLGHGSAFLLPDLLRPLGSTTSVPRGGTRCRLIPQVHYRRPGAPRPPAAHAQPPPTFASPRSLLLRQPQHPRLSISHDVGSTTPHARF